MTCTIPLEGMSKCSTAKKEKQYGCQGNTARR